MIKFNHHDGCTTVGKNPLIALRYWYGAFHRRPLPPDLPRGRITLIVGEPIKYPTEGPEFIDLLLAACERTYNKVPEVTSWDCWPPETDEECVECSRLLLLWLSDNGYVTNLTHDGELS
jgi:1-acyl-sn-glycerol-3-phosphate acyltransferase